MSLGLDMVMGCFLLAMVVGGKKGLRMLVYGGAACSSIGAYWFLPKYSHVVSGALTGGILGALWGEKSK